jgi:hypothetical protein
MQDHHAAAVYDEADLPPEGTVKTLGEIRQNFHEEISGERDVVDGFERQTWRDDRDGPIHRPGLRRRGNQHFQVVVGGGWGIELDLWGMKRR